MADDIVLMASCELATPVPEHSLCGRVDEGGPLVEVEAVDAFGRGGRDRLVLADQTLQILFVPPRLRDVLNLDHEIQGPVPGVAHHGDAQQHPHGSPVLMDVAILGVVVSDLPRQ
jgi:hypothetical protein